MATCFGLREIGFIYVVGKDQFRRVKMDRCIVMSGHVIEELDEKLHICVGNL